MKRVLFVLSVLALLAGCNKEPGEGGKAEIRGRVIEQRYSLSGNPIGDPYAVIGENVYIVYGETTEGVFPDDNVDTGPNGEFRFPWLRKGEYTIFVRSECRDCSGGTKAVIRSASIGDAKEVVDLGIIPIENY
ncbi:MAG TPA: lipoprotein [Flavobacteriales bacterium]|nr:lipoprotein [Flavobacteriales bacterium]